MALKCLSVALAASAASARFIFDRSLNDTVGFRNDTISIQENAPGYGGFNLIWQETFPGAAGQLPNEGNWNIITNLHVNNEWQDYTRSSQNMQMSGGATLQIVPRKDASGKWTSGRLESKYVFTPADGRVTRAEARIRFGSAVPPNSAGLWPAFWMLGNSIRNGVSWPACGEIDIMERVRGEFTGYGTIHCDVYPGGACNEPTGRGGAIGIPDQGWHTWRVDIDRQPGNWADESLTWYRDGQQFHRVTGGQLGQGVWNSLGASPLFFILNVAVGGNWPGAPNDQTWDSFPAMMEVAYVAHYQTG